MRAGRGSTRVCVSAAAVWITLAGLMTACQGSSSPEAGETGAVGFPDRAIDLVIPFDAGGTVGIIGTEYARMLSEELGVSVVLDYQPGGGGSLGTNNVVTGESDGYTIAIAPENVFTFSPLVNPDLSFDTSTDDYELIGATNVVIGGMIAVHADAQWATFDEMLADARTRPGEITISTPGVFNLLDIAMRVFNAENDGIFRLVPFDGGGGEAMTALLSEQVDANIGNPVTLQGQLEAGELRGLVYLADERWQKEIEALDGVPSIREYDSEANSTAFEVVIVHKDTPADALSVLREAHLAVVTSTEFEDFIRSIGAGPEPLGAEEAEAALEKSSTFYQEIYDTVDLGQ